jgi:GNAT superfamily N-acetyltransferase
MSDTALRLVAAGLEDPEAQALVDQVQAEYARLYGTPDVSPIEHEVFRAPTGAFFLGYDGGAAVAMGGWRRRADVRPWGRSAAAEVKRMYVAPAARRRGHARAVLAHLEATAREAGADVMVLETGLMQPEAIALYRAEGYLPVDSFGYYADSPLSLCLGKPL